MGAGHRDACGGWRRWRRAISARRSTGMPRRWASTTSGLVGGTAVETATRSASPTWAASWPTTASHAERPQPLEPGRRLEVAAGDLVAHGRQHGGDGAHARAADAHHVDPAGPVEVEADRFAGRSCDPRAGRGRVSHGRAPRPGRRPRPPPRAGPSDRPARPMSASRSGSASRASSSAASRSAVSSRRGRAGPRRPAPAPGRWPSGGRPGARAAGRGSRQPDRGQLGDGRGAGPAHGEVGGREDQVHPVLVPDLLVDEALRDGHGGAAASDLVPVPLADDVADGEVGPVPPAAGQADDGVVDPAGAERAAGDGDHRAARRAGRARPGPPRAAGRAAVDGQYLGPDRVAGDHGPGQVGALEGHRRWPGRTGPPAGWRRRARRSARPRRAGPAADAAAITQGTLA